MTYTRTWTWEERALGAMCDREMVQIKGGIRGRIDEIYVSVEDPSVRRMRVTESSGRVHHVNVSEIDYNG